MLYENRNPASHAKTSTVSVVPALRHCDKPRGLCARFLLSREGLQGRMVTNKTYVPDNISTVVALVQSSVVEFYRARRLLG